MQKEINLTTEEASGSSFLSAADDLDTDEEILRCEDPSPVVSDFASVSVDTTIEDAAINTVITRIFAPGPDHNVFCFSNVFLFVVARERSRKWS